MTKARTTTWLAFAGILVGSAIYDSNRLPAHGQEYDFPREDPTPVPELPRDTLWIVDGTLWSEPVPEHACLEIQVPGHPHWRICPEDIERLRDIERRVGALEAMIPR